MTNQEYDMTDESNRPVNQETESASNLKASDFFPPGSGWNRAPANDRQKSPEQLQQEEFDAQRARGDLGQH